MSQFSEDLKGLFALAGNPTLGRVAEAVAERSRVTRTSVPAGLGSRIGEWRAGKHLPSKFDSTVTSVLVELHARATARGATSGNLNLQRWHTVWRASREVAGKAPTLCPFPGLGAYTESESDLFFGRDAAIERLVGLVTDAARAGGDIVVLSGVSGAGKSSLLAAAVVPALHTSGSAVLSIRPGSDPFGHLAEAMGKKASEVSAENLLPALRRWGLQRGASSTVVVVDQAEELITAATAETRAAFLGALDAVVSSKDRGGTEVSHPVVVLIGLRADFLATWFDSPVLVDAANRRLLVLGSMSRSELLTVITEPAKKSGTAVDRGLADLAVAELCGHGDGYDAGALPLLNHALAATWEYAESHRLSIAAYHAVGGVAGALTASAEAVWSALSEDEQHHARRLLIRLVHIGEDSTQDTRRTYRRDELLSGAGTEAENVLNALVGGRLITVEGDANVTLTHEIVLRRWPRLRAWVDENRADHLALQKLEQDAEIWGRSGRDQNLLYRGSQIEKARGATERGGTASQLARHFIQQSENTAGMARKRAQQRQFLLWSATVTAIILALVSIRSCSSATTQQHAAEVGRIQAQADRLQLSDPSVSAQLALLAYRMDDSAENHARVLATAALPLARTTPARAGAIYSLAISPDGSMVAAAGADAQIHLWARGAAGALRSVPNLEGHQSFVTSVAWSPKSDALASTSNDGTIRIWERQGEGFSLKRVLNGTGRRVVFAAWSPDGQQVVSGGYDNAVRVWDVNSGRPRAIMVGHTSNVRTVAWSPDGSTIASGGEDRTVRIWDARSYTSLAVLGGHTNITHSVAFSPSGRLLATGSDDTTVQLWSMKEPGKPMQVGAPLRPHTGPIWSATFGSHEDQLLTASLDGTAKVWNIKDPTHPLQLGATLAGAGSAIYSADMSSDGQYVVTGSADGAVRTWSLPRAVLTGHSGKVWTPALAGDRMVSAGSDGPTGVINLWDVSDPTRPRLRAHDTTPNPPQVVEVAMTSAGLIAAATVDNHVRLLAERAGTLVEVGRIDTMSVDQRHVAFSPDGRYLLASQEDSNYRIWDVRDPSRPTALGLVTHGKGGKWSTTAVWVNTATVITAGTDHELDLWDLSDPLRPVMRNAADSEHEGPVNALAVAGGVVASGGDDATIRTWKVVDGRLTRLSDEPTYTPGRHTIRTLGFSDDGSQLMAAGDGQTIAVWDARHPERLSSPGVVSVPGDGRWYAARSATVIAAGGDSGALQVLPLTDFAERRVCEETSMTDVVWRLYVPAEIGDPPCK